MRNSYWLIRRANLLFFALCVSLALFSCEGDDGSEGPVAPKGEQGEKGNQGEKGEPGTPGTDGKDARTKEGYFEGTITGTRRSGQAFNETFKYEYLTGQYQEISDDLSLMRFSHASEHSSVIELFGTVQDKGTKDETLIPITFFFTFIGEIDIKRIFILRCNYQPGRSTLEISNYIRNATTGVISLDFKYTDNGSNSTANPITITGKFNSGNTVYEEVISRKGN